jgi:hypothetical protein
MGRRRRPWRQSSWTLEATIRWRRTCQLTHTAHINSTHVARARAPHKGSPSGRTSVAAHVRSGRRLLGGRPSAAPGRCCDGFSRPADGGGGGRAAVAPHDRESVAKWAAARSYCALLARTPAPSPRRGSPARRVGLRTPSGSRARSARLLRLLPLRRLARSSLGRGRRRGRLPSQRAARSFGGGGAAPLGRAGAEDGALQADPGEPQGGLGVVARPRSGPATPPRRNRTHRPGRDRGR